MPVNSLMRLTFVIPSLELGGAEGVLARLVNAWAERGREITVIVFDQAEGPSYPLHPAITLCNLNVPNLRATHFLQAFWRNFQRIRRLRRAIRRSRPDVVVSYMDFPNVVTLLATRGLHVPVIVTEHANPDYVDIGRLWNLLRRRMYPLAAMLVCPTGRMAALLQQRFKVPGRGIPNPIQMSSAPAAVTVLPRSSSKRVMAGVGRLVPQKGFDLLLDAFSRIANRHPEWSVTIIGKGPLKEQLEVQAKSLGLADRMNFTGALADPLPVLRAADLFVFPSRFEGFGNAMVEAMACGLPAISFDCVAGPSDIIRDGIDGILVPPEDVNALAAAMDRLMSDPQERAKLASRAPEVLTRFSLERILVLWDELFDQVVSGERRLASETPLQREHAAPHQ
jgi:glycosyltransferase involved in cell wall biosynthesis